MSSEAAIDADLVYQQRLKKRLESIEMVKQTANYLAYSSSASRTERSQGDPRTPSPGGPSTSARQFRYRIKVWRDSLYEWNVAAHAPE